MVNEVLSAFAISCHSVLHGVFNKQGCRGGSSRTFLKPVPPVSRATGPSLAAQERELCTRFFIVFVVVPLM